MSKEQDDQDYEDAFNELADEDVSEADDSDEDGQEGESSEDNGADGDATNSDRADDGGDGGDDPEDHEAMADKYRRESQEWQHRYNSDLGRQNALQRKVQQLEEDNRKLQSAKPADMTNKEWSELKADYPEIATAIESKFAEKDQARDSELTSLRDRLEQMQQRDEQSYRDAQYKILEAQHPDWKNVAASQEFGAWIKQQPKGVQTLIESEDAADAAYLLNLYRPKVAVENNSDIRERRTRRLQQAQTVPNRGGRVRSNLPAEDDYEASFDYYASKS